MYIYTLIHIYTCTHIYIYTYMRIYVYNQIYIHYVCMYIYIYICMCIHIWYMLTISNIHPRSSCLPKPEARPPVRPRASFHGSANVARSWARRSRSPWSAWSSNRGFIGIIIEVIIRIWLGYNWDIMTTIRISWGFVGRIIRIWFGQWDKIGIISGT